MNLKALITLSCVILYTNSCLAQPTNIRQYLFESKNIVTPDMVIGNPPGIPDSASGLDVLKLIKQTSGSDHVAKDSSNHVEQVSLTVSNLQPIMIQGEIDYVVRTNWIDESVTRKLPENAGEYTMHQVGQVATNIEARFVFDGQLHIVNLGIKLATNVYRRDRVFSKRIQIDTPPVPGVLSTNNISIELPYSQRTSYRIP